VELDIQYVNPLKIITILMRTSVGLVDKFDVPGGKFPVDMDSAAGVVAWMYAYGLGMLDAGRPCSLRNMGQKPYASSQNMTELNSDMLVGVAELLRNKTATDILHSIPLPKNTTEVMRLLPGDTFMDAAGLQRSEASTMLGYMTVVQYGLYQVVYREHHACPIPEVRCGKNVNPCDVYPPVSGPP